jgi:hypothetical protein
MIKQRPARYRSKTTGQFVSEDYAHEHPDEAYAVGGGPSRVLLIAVATGIAAVALGAVFAARARG